MWERGKGKLPAHKLQELQVVLRHVGEGGGEEALLRGGGEEVQAGVEDTLDGLLKELLEHAVLIDSRLVQALQIHKLHPGKNRSY